MEEAGGRRGLVVSLPGHDYGEVTWRLVTGAASSIRWARWLGLVRPWPKNAKRESQGRQASIQLFEQSGCLDGPNQPRGHDGIALSHRNHCVRERSGTLNRCLDLVHTMCPPMSPRGLSVAVWATQTRKARRSTLATDGPRTAPWTPSWP